MLAIWAAYFHHPILFHPAMNESFLHYVWRFQSFDRQELQTQDGKSLRILHPGHANTHAGPDLYYARILLDGVEWNGTVELHVRSSAWKQHGHDLDPVYNGVILHVVWEDDVPACRQDGSWLPTLCLSGRVAPELWHRYQALVQAPVDIACATQLRGINPPVWRDMLSKALADRMEHKTLEVMELYDHSAQDWDETAYRLLLRHIGFGVNQEPFVRLAAALPWKVVQRYTGQAMRMEALFFGQAGFLEGEIQDDYQAGLQREYRYLSHKHGLEWCRMEVSDWRFLRMRPANFPTVRLAQVAGFLSERGRFFAALLLVPQADRLLDFFGVAPGAYWQQHYHFGRPLVRGNGLMGKESARLLIVNVVVPLLMAYGVARDSQSHKDRAIHLLEAMPPESNHLTAKWETLGMPLRTAADTQAAIGQIRQKCQPRQCLSCTIGTHLLQRSPKEIEF